MARSAVFRRGLVEKNRLAVNYLTQTVASFAANLAMCSLQSKTSLPVVIEKRRFPFRAVVTRSARRNASFGKLHAVNILVTCLAFVGRCFEIGAWERSRGVWRAMTSATLRGRMGTGQRETGPGMVEGQELIPCGGGVAGLTLQRLSIQSNLLHDFLESPLVGIGVASGATQVLPVIERRRSRFECCGRFVAIAAGNSHMSPVQPKPRFIMSGEAECGGKKSLKIVAILAAIEMRHGGELAGVRIVVAIRAMRELQFVERVFAFGNMTLPTRERGMFALQRIRGRGVFLQTKLRRLEAVDAVAGRTFIAGRSLRELPAVRVRPVAVRAFLKYQRLTEIALGVALHTINLGVLAEQREFRLVMVECAIQGWGRNPVPANRGVAGLASLREPAMVGIGMAVCTVTKRYSRVTRLFVHPDDVASLAANFRMRAGERVACERVIELADVDRLPVAGVMTLQAIGAEPAIVAVLMASDAARRNSQECVVQILDFDGRAFAAGDVPGQVTLVAA